jgi:4-hydroxyphenylacetate 3-monooxygenase
MRLLLGVCAKITQATGADQIPAVKETLGRISAQEAMIAAMVNGQIHAFEKWPDGYVCFNRRMMYAALEWSTQNYSRLIDELRELSGGGVFQMPADFSVLNNADLARDFQTYWHTPQSDAVARMKLFKLAWDLVGSEFAGRHQQYEKFYAGAPFIVRGHSFRETDWRSFEEIVERLVDSYGCERGISKAASSRRGDSSLCEA